MRQTDEIIVTHNNVTSAMEITKVGQWVIVAGYLFYLGSQGSSI